MNFLNYYEARKQRINDYLANSVNKLPKSDLQEAMLYSLMNGGKRLRPLLVYATGEALGGNLDTLDIPAAAIECMHSFSLIHDDLPAMDDDDFRRGKPSCHKAFGEAIAILAGDALQATCFEILTTTSTLTPNQQAKMVHLVAQASGAAGMEYGQALDIKNQQNLTLDELNLLHFNKTGKILEASIMLAVIATNYKNQEFISQLVTFSKKIGLAFQIHDDILDIEGEETIIGKPTGSDDKFKKVTYPKLMGMKTAKEMLETLYQEALYALNIDPLQQSKLVDIVHFMMQRDR